MRQSHWHSVSSIELAIFAVAPDVKQKCVDMASSMTIQETPYARDQSASLCSILMIPFPLMRELSSMKTKSATESV